MACGVAIMKTYWIVYKNVTGNRHGFKRKYLARPFGNDGSRWSWTYTGHASRFTDDALAYEYAVKYKGSVEEVTA